MGLAGKISLRGTFDRWSKRAAPPTGGKPHNGGSFALVRHATTLSDVAKVEQHLPEIMGRALARGWVDSAFNTALMANPKGLLAAHHVFLPDSISLEVETTASQRLRIVVYERTAHGGKRRVMYLQLVMMAGR
jgi:hypothetical protein